MKFIDLFAGLGGFHLALSELGHECVFASEKKLELIELYKENFEMEISGDINKIKVNDIPPHDILCAGFPCQPFSHAGNQLGLKDPNNGNFFDKILEIANFHKTEYIFLENVPNLKNHDNGNTWDYISNHLLVNYEIKDQIISPHQLGVPQHRRRIYIVGRLRSRGGLSHFNFPQLNNHENFSINSIIDSNPVIVNKLKEDTQIQLKVWQDFLNYLNQHEVPSFPIWAMEFGADYDYDNIAPAFQNLTELEGRKGTFGKQIIGKDRLSIMESLPIYARTAKDREFPIWKKRYIKQNREFYLKHKDWLDNWIPNILHFKNSHQKLEWNCGNNGDLTIIDKIVQFRPSGIRIKQPTFSPALVLTTTQIPIFPWLNRYMTINEAAKLQCMQKLTKYPETFQAFGNAVNVCVVKQIAKNLII